MFIQFCLALSNAVNDYCEECFKNSDDYEIPRDPMFEALYQANADHFWSHLYDYRHDGTIDFFN